MNEAELYHYGVQGMKWGVRKARMKSNIKIKSTKPRARPSDDGYRAAILREKARSGGKQALSNEELRILNERTQLETHYNKLNPSQVEVGRQKVLLYIGTVGTIAGAASAILSLRNQIKKK